MFRKTEGNHAGRIGQWRRRTILFDRGLIFLGYFPQKKKIFQVGLVYVFNLIVGTGALALPKAFQSTGYVLSVVLLLISAFTRYYSYKLNNYTVFLF